MTWGSAGSLVVRELRVVPVDGETPRLVDLCIESDVAAPVVGIGANELVSESDGGAIVVPGTRSIFAVRGLLFLASFFPVDAACVRAL